MKVQPLFHGKHLNACMKIAIFLLFFLMLFANIGTVYGEEEETNSTVKMNFPDVSIGHWAHPYITKLALQGIVIGDENGNFNPNDTLTQQNAIIMAINFMGLKDVVQNYEQSGVLPFQVDDYARAYVGLALEIGLLNAREELLTEGDEIWGRRPATREWIAKITIRAIQQEDEALELAGRTAPFSDHADISAWALGYINRAVDLDIVSGFEDGEFKPKGIVTRAQMAVFLSRSEQYLRHLPDRVYTGLVTEIDENYITIENEEDGRNYTFQIDDQAVVYNSTSSLEHAYRSDIALFYKVYVIAVNNKAYYIDIQDDEINMESINGRLLAKDFDNAFERKITVLSEGKYVTFTLAPNVMVVDADGNGMSLSALVENSDLILRRYVDADRPEIVQIVVVSVPVNKSGEAVIYDISNRSLTISDDDMTEETYPIADDALITYNNIILNGTEDLHPGDKIEYELENSYFTKIRVTESVVPHFTYDEGIIDSLNQDRIYLFKSSQELTGYFVAEEVEIDIDGKENATIYDLFVGDRVKLTISQNKEITHIEVLDREIEKKIQVEIVYYDDKTSSLMLRLDNDTTELFKLTNDTVIRTDSARINLENFGNLFTNGKMVDIVYSKDKLIEIKLSSYYDGTISKLNQMDGTLTLNTSNLGEIDFIFTNALVISPDSTGSTLGQLAVGDEVRITLDSSQDEVSLIQLKKTKIYELVSRTSLKLVVRDQDGEIKEIGFSYLTPIVLPDGQTGTVNDIPFDSPIMVSFMGTTVEKILIPDSTLGKVTDIDFDNERFQILGYDGRTYTYTFSNEIFIVKDGRTFDDMKDVTLEQDDRVEIAEDNEGNLYIHIFRAMTKKFWKYSTSEQTVSFRRSNLNEDYEFEIDDQTFIHDDWVPIPLSTFNNGDDVVVYLKGNRIVEMQK